MQIESVIAVRIARATLPCLALAGLIGWAHAPKADIPSTLENLYEFEYDIRLGVTLYFPGASPLKERARRYQ